MNFVFLNVVHVAKTVIIFIVCRFLSMYTVSHVANTVILHTLRSLGLALDLFLVDFCQCKLWLI